MRFAFVAIVDLPTGGGGSARLLQIARGLSSRGHTVEIWAEHPLGVAPSHSIRESGSADGIPYEYMSWPRGKRSGWELVPLKVRALIRLMSRIIRSRSELDVVWLNNLFLYEILPVSALCRLLGIKTVQAYEDERPEVLNRTSSAQLVMALNAWLGDSIGPIMADMVVVISEYLRKKYEPRARKLLVLPTLVDVDEWTCPPITQNRTRTVLYSGTFGEQDDVIGLAEACAHLWHSGFSDLRLVLAGSSQRNADEVERVRNVLEAAGVSNKFEFAGFLPRPALRDEICRADLLYAVRRDTQFGRSGLATKLSEYLATGRPVLASAIGETERLLIDGRNAYMVKPGASKHDLANAIRIALEAPLSERTRVGEAGRETAANFFDRQTNILALESVVSKIVRGTAT